MGRLANLVDAVEAASKKIRAYHGSPHDFDRFSLDHIGTGEGAQMYGHGLYFADNIDVAKSYSPRDYDAEQLMLDRQARAMNNEDYLEAEFWDQAMLHKTPDEIMEFAGEYGDDEAIEAAQRVVDYMDSHGMRQNLMEVDINADPESLLDWDKPLSEQSQVIQDVARNLDISETGAMGKTAGVMRAYQEGRDVGLRLQGKTYTGRFLTTDISLKTELGF